MDNNRKLMFLLCGIILYMLYVNVTCVIKEGWNPFKKSSYKRVTNVVTSATNTVVGGGENIVDQGTQAAQQAAAQAAAEAQRVAAEAQRAAEQAAARAAAEAQAIAQKALEFANLLQRIMDYLTRLSNGIDTLYNNVQYDAQVIPPKITGIVSNINSIPGSIMRNVNAQFQGITNNVSSLSNSILQKLSSENANFTKTLSDFDAKIKIS